ncbi:MAG: PspA/IM30 family protein [Candidatus Tectomicrobia bacterium]|nr:PspA/IM30 family protein [Candidatus Tectomicrobia bacterium]
MAGIFQRLFKLGQSETHALVDKFEDPIKMTEQGIRDLKKDLQGSMQSLAQVKALALRMQKDADNNKRLAAEYERKAMLLLSKIQSGELDQAEAERLATEALNRKEEATRKALESQKDYESQEKMSSELQVKVEKLRRTVQSYENDLTTLKARARTAAATTKINRQLSTVDASSTLAMLEKMRARVEEDESLATAYGGLVDTEKSVDEEINRALAGSTGAPTDKLAELKAKMGIK